MSRRISVGLALALACASVSGSRAQSSDVFINEFHYDNASTDAGEFVEVAGTAGTSLTGYSIVLYNGSSTSRASYKTVNLSGTIPDQQNGFGTVAFAIADIQNGAPDGMALAHGTTVLQFLSYEGSFTAVNDVAAGRTSTDIGVSEPDTTPAGHSLQLAGTYPNFSWVAPAVASSGAVNANQNFGSTTPSLSINNVTLVEGNTGTQAFVFTISLTAPAPAGGVSFAVNTEDGTADAGADYQAVTLTDTIAEGSNSYTVSVPVIGDLAPEGDETFLVQVSQVTNANVVNGTGTGTITNDDSTPAPPTNIIINELDSDTPGTDVAEFVELFDGGAGNTSLSGLTLVFYNGNGDVSYAAIDLDGQSTDARGYFTVGNAAVPGVDLVFAGNLLQNGADAAALFVANASDFPNGSSVRTAGLVDAVVYDTDDADDAGLLALLNTGQPQVNEAGDADPANDSIQRCPNGEGGARNTTTFAAIVATPDADNALCPVPPPPAEPRTIAEIQGTTDQSPFVNTDVITSGVVTGRKTNGFFLQSVTADSDPQTSEAVFVFTNAPPLVTDNGTARLIELGDVVEVTGRVVEFKRTADARPETLTEISAPVVVLQGEGHALPPAIAAEAIFSANVATRVAQLERYESMLITAGPLRAVAPTNGFGEFFAVLDGVARPFREPGVLSGDQLPADAPANVPTFDGNFERIMIESDEQTLFDNATPPNIVRRTPLQVSTGAVVTGVFGPLDYGFNEYRIQVDASAPLQASGGVSAAMPVPDAAPNQFTIGSANLLNFINPPAERVAKGALMIRTVLRTPAILGLIEVGTLADIQQLAAAVNADAGTMYDAVLLDANGTSNNEQNIGFLIDRRRAELVGTPEQLFKGKTFTFAGQTDILHDRPPLVIKANMLREGTTQKVPVTVMLLHLKSLIEVDSNEPFGTGSTLGARNREKRRLGAEDVANAIAERSDDNLVVLGDLNAFEFNDGYGDIVGTIRGVPAPADQVVAASVDVWDYELTHLLDVVTDPQQRYSYTFAGSAQVLDHVLVSGAMTSYVSGLSFARNNADFPGALATDLSRPERFSDHDAPVAYFTFPPLADLSLAMSANASVQTGSAFTYAMQVANAGPDDATDVVVSVAAQPGFGVATVTSPQGWSCTSMADGALTCTAGTVAAGSTTMFTVQSSVSCATVDGAVLSQTASIVNSTPEETLANNVASYAITAINPAPVIQGLLTPIVVAPIPGASSAGAVVADALFGTPSVSDNCGGATLTRTGVPAGNLFPVGTTLVTYVAIDSAGAMTTAVVSVTVLSAIEALEVINAELTTLIGSQAQPQVARQLADARADVRHAIDALTAPALDESEAAQAVAKAVQEIEKLASDRALPAPVAQSLLARLVGVNWLLAIQTGAGGGAIAFGNQMFVEGKYHVAAVTFGTAIK